MDLDFDKLTPSQQRELLSVLELNRIRRKNKRKAIMLRLFMLMLLLLLSACVGGGIGIIKGMHDSIDYSKLDQFKFYGDRVKMYDKNGDIVKTYYDNKTTSYLKLDEMNKDWVNHYLTIEDKRFYQHNGIDLKGIIRALVVNFTDGERSQGASTITQQLIRSQILTTDKTFKRKINEMFMAIELEKNLDKDTILEMYLNTVYLGYNNYGVESASQFYWGKSFNDLTLSQLCSLIPIIQSPNRYNPIVDLEMNNTKRETVLNTLLVNEAITQTEYDKALQDKSYADTKISKEEYNKKVSEINTYYLDNAYNQVVEDLMKKFKLTRDEAINKIISEGYQIYTYYDPEIDKILQEHMLNREFAIDDKVQTGIVILDNNGVVLGVAGGYGEKTANFVFDRSIHAKRQPGSTFKPLVSYVPAFEYLGLNPDSYVVDEKRTYVDKWGNEYSPNNYNHKYKGQVPLRYGVEWSVNSIAVDLLDRVGIDDGLFVAEQLGISTLVYNRNGLTDRGLATALGGLTDGVTPMDMAVAYNSIKTSNKSKPKFYRKVFDENGNEILSTVTDTKYAPIPVIETRTSAYMTDCLLDVVQTGTGRGLKIKDLNLAGKTGTTNDSCDLWFVGYTPEITMSLWYGYDKKETLQTSDAHLKLYKSILEDIYELESYEKGNKFKFNKLDNTYMDKSSIKHENMIEIIEVSK